MFCPQCGTNNDPAARHCSQCGAALQPSQPAAPLPVAPPPPAYIPPAAYQNAPQNAFGAPLAPGTVPNYMVQSVLVTLCCCLPLGIVGIVKAGEVNNRLAVGDYDGALKASKTVKTCLWIGVGLNIAGWIVYGILVAIGVFVNANGGGGLGQ
jgi:hypothetical protein